MAKTTKKSKKPAKPAKKPFTVEIHGEDFDLSLSSRNNSDDDEDDLSWIDKFLEKISAYTGAKQQQRASQPNLREQILSDLELIEAIAERDPDEDPTAYATSIVAIAMAFGRKLDSNMLRIVIHTLQTEYNERPATTEPETQNEATPHE